MNLLLKHFSQGNQTPVMLDDGIVAKVVLYARLIKDD